MRLKHYILVAIAVVILLPLAIMHGVLRASLAKLDGSVPSSGLTAPVKIERDRLGVATLTAANRVDLAYATGFIHAQDRFFEMDLSRRLAGGELSELFGAVAVEQDKQTRLFHFRKVARAVIEAAPPEQRAVLEAYARGVNAGLAELGSRPWEYWVLGSPPVAWRPEDTILVEHSMWWDLQANGLQREMLRREINARIGGKECDAGWKCGLRFFYPARTEWDAPDGVLSGPGGAPATASDIVPPAAGIPGPDVLDVRGATAAAAAGHGAATALAGARGATPPGRGDADAAGASGAFPSGTAAGDGLHDAGSNNWALAVASPPPVPLLSQATCTSDSASRLSGITLDCARSAPLPSRRWISPASRFLERLCSSPAPMVTSPGASPTATATG